MEIGEEEELNYPHQKIRTVVDKEKKKVNSKKDCELKKKDDTIKKLKMKKKEQMKCQKGLQELTLCKSIEKIMHSEPEILKLKRLQGKVMCEQLSKSIHEEEEGGEKNLHIKSYGGKKSSLKFLTGGRVKTSDKKGWEKEQSSDKFERDITFFEDDRNSRILPGKKGVIKSESGRQQYENCKSNKIHFSDFKENYIGVYLKWQTFKETYTDKNGNQKTIQKMNKYVITANLWEMVLHQHEVLKYQKENLQFNEAVIHMDFSENYKCKFAEETQAFHFGSSGKQVSLDTVSFCTLSDYLEHSVHAIWVHLKSILKTLPDSINTIHFWSDSPSTQY
ncbi:hypothetical protein PR048_013598 [Dryococelus australis]|uniref:Uncharacterized protein n=1 Tax=Dryococelus australis TaxID=614101 RepID=A0ABQ9HSM8_9NEOP|nr:hypothetical protein PR048_013598 [Dryococelus australis]